MLRKKGKGILQWSSLLTSADDGGFLRAVVEETGPS